MRQVLRISLATVLLVGGVIKVDAACYSYTNSTPTYVAGYGSVCGGYGPGCTECATDDGSASCVTDSTSCTPKVQHKNTN
jgi:hypothetical protein